MFFPAASTLIAVDVGNSRIKLGRFERRAKPNKEAKYPEPTETFDVPVVGRSGKFEAGRLADWCTAHVANEAAWLVASVHRGASERLVSAVTATAAQSSRRWQLRHITYRDVPMPIAVDEPACVGIDRLLAALAANHLRRGEPASCDWPAIVVDLGSAITVDFVQADGVFAGGSILPGIGMSARALHEQTDALPQIGATRLDRPPDPLGKSTVKAMESGLYWGAVGAIRELITRMSADQSIAPVVLLTGGASPHVADLLASAGGCGERPQHHWTVHHVPHLVLSGIALVDQRLSPQE